MRSLVLFLFAIPAMAQNYDLLLKGGHVIDPKNGIDAVRDVAIAGGKVAAIAPQINADDAKKVIDARGLYVTPGLIDIHAHVFAGSRHNTTAGGDRSVFPDQASFRSGVTTMVDPGSSGWRSFEEFRRTIIDVARTRVLAMLNIAGVWERRRFPPEAWPCHYSSAVGLPFGGLSRVRNKRSHPKYLAQHSRNGIATPLFKRIQRYPQP